MKINFLFPAAASAFVDDTSTLLAVSSHSQSAKAMHLMMAVGHRNVTTMQALVQEIADESVNEPGWKFDDDIKAALHAIRDTFVKGIQRGLRDEHKNDQEHFNCFTKECFGACNSGYVGDADSCKKKGEQCDSLQQTHAECREEVFSKYKDMAKNCAALHCFDISDPSCQSEDCLCPDLTYCHKKSGDSDSCEARAGDCKGKFGGWLQSMITKYKSAYAEWQGLYTTCKRSYHEFLTVDMQCDTTQKEFERCSCEKSRCDYTVCGIDFTQCTEQCWGRYDELVKEKECLEKDRKIDWSATKKIECYVDILLHDYTKEELLTKCGSDDCINKAREEDYKHCATVCPKIDYDGDWPRVLSVDPGNVKIEGHALREEVSQYLLGDSTYKCDTNGLEVFTKHRGGVDREGEDRCTEHLDFDYQIPECITPECKKVPVCDAAFHKKYYSKYDDISKIGSISECCPEDEKSTCFSDVTLESSSDGNKLTAIRVAEHSKAWAYNRCECQNCAEGFPEYTPPSHQCGAGAHTLGSTSADSTSLGIFVRWGHRECPDGATALYTGYTAGSHYTHHGSGYNTLCLHPNPTYLDHNSGNQNGALLYGTEYEKRNNHDVNVNGDAVCTVCQTVSGATFTQWGRSDCASNQRTEYKGYIMSSYYSHKSSGQYVCVDEARMVHEKSHSANKNGNLWYTTEYESSYGGADGALPNEIFKNDLEASCAQCTLPEASSVYVRWGHRECPDGATALYTGYTAGSHYTHSGSGANTLCLHPDPTYLDHNAGNQNGALLYGTEYEKRNAHDVNVNGDAVCTLCTVSGATFTQWGSTDCADNQRTEYKGYIMSSYYTHKSSGEFVCVDEARMVHEKSHSANKNGNLWYTTEYESNYGGDNGALPNEIFKHNHEATCAQCTLPEASSVYVRWGHKECPAAATTVYSGYTAGSHYKHQGSGVNTLCLHPSPTYLDHNSGDQNGALLYGTEYEPRNANVDVNVDGDAACAVCAVSGVSFTQWGSTDCADNQRTEYKGYIMSSYYSHKSAGEYVCVDEARMVHERSHSANKNGNLWYTTEYESNYGGADGSLPNEIFKNDHEAACAQCTII